MATKASSKKALSGSVEPEYTELDVAGTIKVTKAAPYDDEELTFKQSHNMSGLLCPDGADWCLMVADERKGVHRLKVIRKGKSPKVKYGEALDLELPSRDFLRSRRMKDSDLKELDLEAIADVGEKGALAGQVILVGSHANERNTGNVNPGAHLVAIADKADLASKAKVPARWASLDGLLRRMFPGALYQQLQCDGVNIEGATVFGKRLMIGLRSPTRRGDKPAAYVISTPLDGLAKEDFSRAKLHVLRTGKTASIGIRSMEAIGDIILLVTGDAGVNDLESGEIPACGANLNKENIDRPFQLRAWKPKKGNRLERGALAVFEPVEARKYKSAETSRAKVEGITVAEKDGNRISLFVVYDGSDKVFYLPDIKLPK